MDVHNNGEKLEYQIIRGTYKDDLLEGKALTVQKDGTYEVGNFVEEVYEGVSYVRFPDKSQYLKCWFEKGKLMKQEPMKGGEK